MARVVVTDDSGDRVLMDEQVQKVHLENRHSSLQMIERLVWAVEDADGDREPSAIPSLGARRDCRPPRDSQQDRRQPDRPSCTGEPPRAEPGSLPGGPACPGSCGTTLVPQ